MVVFVFGGVFGGFVYVCESKIGVSVVSDVSNPLVFSGLLVGAMFPYAISALVMKSALKIGLKIREEIKILIRNDKAAISGVSEPDYDAYVMTSI